MSKQINEIIEQLKVLTLLEASELITKIEETFGVDASVVGTASAPTPTSDNKNIEEVEEKTEFNVILEEVPADKKIPILKVVRSLTGLGLKEAKTLVESAPKLVREKLNKADAEDAKKQIELVGGKVSLT